MYINGEAILEPNSCSMGPPGNGAIGEKNGVPGWRCYGMTRRYRQSPVFRVRPQDMALAL